MTSLEQPVEAPTGQSDSRGSRERILDSAIRLLRRQGYSATGIKQIVEEGNAPLGSVYHHFPGGKEQLGIEAIDVVGNRTATLLGRMAGAPDIPVAVNQYFRSRAARLEKSDWELGCPIANVSQEMANGNENIRAACTRVFDLWRSTLTEVFTGAGIPEADALDLATFVLASYEGALTMSRSLHDVTPLVTTGAAVASVVESHLAAAGRAT